MKNFEAQAIAKRAMNKIAPYIVIINLKTIFNC